MIWLGVVIGLAVGLIVGGFAGVFFAPEIVQSVLRDVEEKNTRLAARCKKLERELFEARK